MRMVRSGGCVRAEDCHCRWRVGTVRRSILALMEFWYAHSFDYYDSITENVRKD